MPLQGRCVLLDRRCGGGQIAENALWAYPEPNEDVPWFRNLVAAYTGAFNRWLVEDDEVLGHLRDPYHRVDVRPSSRHAEVRLAGAVIAASDSPTLVFETGLPPRVYLARTEVHGAELSAIETRSTCPYKGVASYFTVQAGETELADGAFTYPEPLDGAGRLRERVGLLGDGIETTLDGDVVGG